MTASLLADASKVYGLLESGCSSGPQTRLARLGRSVYSPSADPIGPTRMRGGTATRPAGMLDEPRAGAAHARPNPCIRRASRRWMHGSRGPVTRSGHEVRTIMTLFKLPPLEAGPSESCLLESEPEPLACRLGGAPTRPGRRRPRRRTREIQIQGSRPQARGTSRRHRDGGRGSVLCGPTRGLDSDSSAGLDPGVRVAFRVRPQAGPPARDGPQEPQAALSGSSQQAVREAPWHFPQSSELRSESSVRRRSNSCFMA